MTTLDTIATTTVAAKPARGRPKATDRGAARPTTPLSKSALVAKLLARPKGATVAEVSSTTGWQAHSVRAFFSGLRKAGIRLVRDARKWGESCYRSLPAENTEVEADAIAVTSLAATALAAPSGPTDLAADAGIA